MTHPYNVFLSYAGKDVGSSDKLRRLLNARRDVRLYSTDDINVGENWQEKLRDALVNSDLFVLMVSPDTLASPWVLQELGAAWALEKPIIAVVAGTNLPIRLPVQLEENQFTYLRSLRKPDDLDPWFERLKDTVTA